MEEKEEREFEGQREGEKKRKTEKETGLKVQCMTEIERGRERDGVSGTEYDRESEGERE